jgi:ribosome-binding factor A
MHKTSPHRNQRLADQIQRDLAELIPRELRSTSLGLITLQGVEPAICTPYFLSACIFIPFLPCILCTTYRLSAAWKCPD